MAAVQTGRSSSVYGYWLQLKSALLFATMLLLVIAALVLEFMISNCMVLISEALNAMDQNLFYRSMKTLFGYVCVNLLGQLCMDALMLQCRIKWRSFISLRWVEAIYGSYGVLAIQRFKARLQGFWKDSVEQHRIGQVIQQDGLNLIDMTDFVVRILIMSFRLVIYSIQLYRYSPAWTFASGWVIPHFLLWAAWLAGLVMSIVPMLINRVLAKLSGDQSDAESRFRLGMMAVEARLRSILNTTGIASWYQAYIQRSFRQVVGLMQKVGLYNLLFDTIQRFFRYVVWLLPYLLMAPLVLSGAMSMADWILLGNFFEGVFYIVSYMVRHVRSYLAAFQSSSRLHMMQKGCHDAKVDYDRVKNQCKTIDDQVFMGAKVTVQPTVGKSYVASFELPASEADKLLGHVLYLKAANGVGKSQLLEVFSGARVGLKRIVPKNYDFFCLSQQAPKLVEEQSVKAYLQINAHGERSSQLNLSQAWEDLTALGFDENDRAKMELAKLSGGQRQKVDLVRALLHAKKNTLLLADEPFSAMDPASIRAAESLLKQRLEHRKLAGVLMVDHSHVTNQVLVEKLKEVGQGMLSDEQQQALDAIGATFREKQHTDTLDVITSNAPSA